MFLIYRAITHQITHSFIRRSVPVQLTPQQVDALIEEYLRAFDTDKASSVTSKKSPTVITRTNVFVPQEPRERRKQGKPSPRPADGAQPVEDPTHTLSCPSSENEKGPPTLSQRVKRSGSSRHGSNKHSFRSMPTLRAFGERRTFVGEENEIDDELVGKDSSPVVWESVIDPVDPRLCHNMRRGFRPSTVRPAGLLDSRRPLRRRSIAAGDAGTTAGASRHQRTTTRHRSAKPHGILRTESLHRAAPHEGRSMAARGDSRTRSLVLETGEDQVNERGGSRVAVDPSFVKNGGSGNALQVEHYTAVAITCTGEALQYILAEDSTKRYFFGLANLCATVRIR